MLPPCAFSPPPSRAQFPLDGKMTKTILVIDDEVDVLDMVRAVLGTKGHTVLLGRGGEEGLAIAAKERPDLIICDLMMPRVSGLEVIKRVKKDDVLKSIPFVVMSALGDDNDRPPQFWIKGLGIDDYVRKPFDPLDLLGRVEYLLRRGTYLSAQPATAERDTPPPITPLAAKRPPASHQVAPDNDTRAPFDLTGMSPQEVVRVFVESWNVQDFASEYNCMGDEMNGQMGLHDYVARRRQTYLEEKGLSRVQRVEAVVEEKVSLNVAKVVIDRVDTIQGSPSSRRETYTLKKTYKGWKIIGCRSAKSEPANKG